MDFDFEPIKTKEVKKDFPVIDRDTSLREPDESRMDLFLWKYNYSFAVGLLEWFVEQIEMDDDILTVQSLFKWTGLSSSYLKKLCSHFSTEPYIEILANQIFDTLEARILEKWLLNKTNSSMTQFYLKNKFYWKDKVEVENTNLNASIQELSDEQKRMIADRYTNNK